MTRPASSSSPASRSRRSFCAGLASLAGAAVTLRGGVAQAAPNALAEPAAEPAAKPAAKPSPKVLIAGDSMISGGFGMFLERALKKEHGYDVARRGRSSSGMARPDFFNWTKEATRLVTERKPDATLLMFGGNDVQGLYMGKGEWIRWGEEGWNEEYARRVNALADQFAPERQQLFWVGLPIMRPDKFRGRCEHVNTIFRAEMALRKNALFIDGWDLLASDEGEFVDYMDVPTANGAGTKKVRVRAHDGIHLSADGAGVLKRHVLKKMLPILERTPAAAAVEPPAG